MDIYTIAETLFWVICTIVWGNAAFSTWKRIQGPILDNDNSDLVLATIACGSMVLGSVIFALATLIEG